MTQIETRHGSLCDSLYTEFGSAAQMLIWRINGLWKMVCSNPDSYRLPSEVAVIGSAALSLYVNIHNIPWLDKELPSDFDCLMGRIAAPFENVKNYIDYIYFALGGNRREFDGVEEITTSIGLKTWVVKQNRLKTSVSYCNQNPLLDGVCDWLAQSPASFIPVLVMD